MQYVILKVLNNNVVFARDDHERELILVGKGIGFGRKSGDAVSAEQVEKVYVFQGEKQREQYLQLIEQVDAQVIGVCEEIIQEASQVLGSLNPHIHVALTDHIAFAIERQKRGQAITNPFLAEIRVLYPKEFQLAGMAVDLIRKRLGHDLPDDEKGFIALHFHSAKTNERVGKSLQAATLINELVKIIEQEMGAKVKEDSLEYARLLTHLRFAIDRAGKGQFTENALLPLLKKDLPMCYNLAEKLVHEIERALHVRLPESEIGYLTIHLSRLQQVIKN